MVSPSHLPRSPHRDTNTHTHGSTRTYTFQLIRQDLETHHHWLRVNASSTGFCATTEGELSVRGLSLCQARKQVDFLCSPTSSMFVREMHPQQRGRLTEQRVISGAVPVTSEQYSARQTYGCVLPLTCCQELMAELVLPNTALWRNTDSSLLIKI